MRLLLVKYAGAAVFCISAPLAVALAGAGIGWVLFPVGPVALLSGDLVEPDEALVRMLLIAAYQAVSLLGLSAIGLFLSTLTDVPVGAMAATIVLSVVSQVLDQLPQLEWLHPWLFTHYWFGFADLLRQPIGWDSFADNALLAGGLHRSVRRARVRQVREQGRAVLGVSLSRRFRFRGLVAGRASTAQRPGGAACRPSCSGPSR